MEKLLEEIAETTRLDLIKQDVETLIINTMEELGEYAAAHSVETGKKKKPLKESSKQEATDVLICAFSLLFAAGGTVEDFLSYAPGKLQKWKDRVCS